jgi:hypothetical protein
MRGGASQRTRGQDAEVSYSWEQGNASKEGAGAGAASTSDPAGLGTIGVVSPAAACSGIAAGTRKGSATGPTGNRVIKKELVDTRKSSYSAESQSTLQQVHESQLISDQDLLLQGDGARAAGTMPQGMLPSFGGGCGGGGGSFGGGGVGYGGMTDPFGGMTTASNLVGGFMMGLSRLDHEKVSGHSHATPRHALPRLATPSLARAQGRREESMHARTCAS